MAATVAAHGPHHQRKNVLLEKAARAGTIPVVATAFGAAELLEKAAPRKVGLRRHSIPPGQSVLF
jgi:hypothetical protein